MDLDALFVFVATNWIEIVGYIGVILTISVYSMKRMITLRCLGIGANLTFIVYGLGAAVYPQLLLHTILLFINLYRVLEILRHVREARKPEGDRFSTEWVRPFASRLAVSAGTTIFSRGDAADAMYITEGGKFRLKEIDKTVSEGDITGELGFLTPDKKRTLTFECVEDGELLVLPYHRLAELYMQNPKLSLYIMRLAGRRLLDDVRRLEVAAAGRDA